jgi:hypothetical protein
MSYVRQGVPCKHSVSDRRFFPAPQHGISVTVSECYICRLSHGGGRMRVPKFRYPLSMNQ